MTIHIYTARSQPATRFEDHIASDLFGRRVIVQMRRRRQLWAGCCRRKRWAAHLNVQVYYDMTRFTCKPGKGCKAK